MKEAKAGADITALFEAAFDGTQHQIFSAPGRVNLIGEHTDYNEGFVLPSAIGFYTHVAIGKRSDNKLAIFSSEFSEAIEVDLANLPSTKQGAWFDYILGVGVELKRAGLQLTGANLLVHGEVPIGAGLSSSAALEVATALAFLSLVKNGLSLEAVAKLCQSAENNFVGAHVGIMDQFVSCFGQKDHALLLDCRSLEFEQVPIPESVKLVICNTMVKHELSGGEYNLRRQQCEQGVAMLSQAYPEVRSLRDVSMQQLASQKASMPEVIFKRCLHVVGENARTLETASRFQSGELAPVGQLMRESHASLRDLYEVSCPELDVMVEAAEGLTGYIGGRMTGGGFGGCTVNLVEAEHAASFASVIAQRYSEKTRITPDTYLCSAAAGAAAGLNRIEV